MRTQERAVGAAGRPPAGMVSPGDRLPSAPRERKPALAALAVLLILVGALGTTVLVMRAGDRVEAVMVTERVPAGTAVPESAIKPVMVAEDAAVDYVLWEQRGLLKSKYRAGTDLVEGAVLTGGMLTTDSGLNKGQRVVGLSLKRGQFPGQLKEGDTVAAYRVDTEAGGGAGGEGPAGGDVVLAAKAKVRSLERPSDGSMSSQLPASLLVKENEAAALTKAASDEAVALVIVPAGD